VLIQESGSVGPGNASDLNVKFDKGLQHRDDLAVKINLTGTRP